ncbi:uncharacterized protein KQ657_004202 [Scheffersomyces spartinae]|uniref:BHLH domain-containing protein n=1 Tax=Scheffersomyces spartinae TaxID=45513 RepID=A0A9P7VBL7_9ASCO|nr:uncharacterized protein KQ657_004202 [Scheffersomyces spartinae]KAG7195086.1 hypothetical protein KQ657_004202 [Scheffersomyces spartinae]
MDDSTDHNTTTDIENNSINDNALKSSSNNPLTTIPTEFDLDFIPSLGESTAFPPSASHFPPPTPLHKALNSSSSSTAADSNHHQQPSTYTEDVLKFISPILPGQNEKSFNDQHFYHRQQQQLLNLSKMSPVNHHRPSVIHQGSSSSVADLYHQPSSQHVRPDVIFTPLVSPAVTPLENVSKSNHKIPLTSFEPLTSPALNAISHEQAQQQQLNQISSKRRSSSSFYAPQKDSSLLHPVTKRRTPHSTPTLAAHNTNSSTTLINSPKIKGLPSTSPNIKLESQQDYPQFDRLPDSSVDEDKDEAVSAQSGSSTPHLMGFTMGKLAQDKAASSSNGSCAPYNSLSRTSSASSTSTGTSQSPTFKGGRPKKLILKTSPIVSPHLGDISKSELVGGGGGGATKKTSHKLAEQVRRNRMNMAVHELGRLVPQSYHDQVTIPSKATTVELGSKYIRDLLAQIDQLQLQLD